MKILTKNELFAALAEFPEHSIGENGQPPKGRGVSLVPTMSYNKTYTTESIRVIHKQIGAHGYLFFNFQYAFVEYKYDVAAGKYVEQYRPFRLSSGISMPKKYWSAEGLSEQYRKDQGGRKYAAVLAEIELQKKRIIMAYDALVGELAKKPSPEQLRDRLSGRTERKQVNLPLAEYIESLAASKKVRDYRTKMKYRTLATYVRALEACRNENTVFQGMSEGLRGVIYVSSFSLKDWSDFALMVQEASTDIPRTYRQTRGARNISFHGEPMYAEATLQKLQAGLLSVLRMAKKDPDMTVGIDIGSLQKIAAKTFRSVHLHPEEIQLILDGSFRNVSTHLENARNLMLLQLFSGVRVSDLPQVLRNPIREVRGRRTTFKAIYLSTFKTGEPICLPLLKPMLDILEGERKPHMIAHQNLNQHYKEVARRLHLDRIIHTVERKANTKRIDHQDELHTILRTHDCRRTFFSMLVGYLFVSRLLATQVTGHRLSNEVVG